MRLGVLAATAALLLPLSLHASTITYTYTGKAFNSFSASGATPQVFTSSDSVTGSFTVASALASNLTLGTITPSSFSFFDGIDTITDQTVDDVVFFQVGTDSSGTINQWMINVTDVAGNQIVASNDQDLGFECVGANCGNFREGLVNNTPGKWTGGGGVVAATPEPGSLVLAGTGVVALAGAVRRRRWC